MQTVIEQRPYTHIQAPRHVPVSVVGPFAALWGKIDTDGRGGDVTPRPDRTLPPPAPIAFAAPRGFIP